MSLFIPIALTIGLASPNVNQICDIAIAGGGPGGIYFAWRLLSSGTEKSICMYERSSRFGGRIYSLRNQGPKADLVVDLGAYRYAPQPYDEGVWSYIYTPLLGALIDDKLKLHSLPYEPGTKASTVRKIVDATGNNAGYATFVEAMMSELKQFKNFHISYNEELASISPPSAAEGGGRTAAALVGLTFSSNLTASAGQVLLNLPQ